jgi:hypothetical protein
MSQHCNATRIFTRWGSFSAHNYFAGVFCILGSIKEENKRLAGMIETVLYKHDITRESEEDEEEHL